MRTIEKLQESVLGSLGNLFAEFGGMMSVEVEEDVRRKKKRAAGEEEEEEEEAKQASGNM